MLFIISFSSGVFDEFLYSCCFKKSKNEKVSHVLTFSFSFLVMGRAKLLGPVLKLVLCVCVLPVILISWPAVGIFGSIVGGLAYGFFSPILATFDAVGEGKTNQLFHCFYVCQ